MLTKEDEIALMKQITATHLPDGREVDVVPLFHLVDDIISHAIPNIHGSGPATQAHLGNLKPMTHHASLSAMLDALSNETDRISSKLKLESDVSDGVNEHETTISLLKMLSAYSWDAKLVLTLVSFAINNGEFWLHSHINSPDYQLPKSIAILKQLPIIMENLAQAKPLLNELTKLIELVLKMTKSIFKFKELPLPVYITEDVPAFSAAKACIPTAVYWIVRSVVACSFQITKHLTTFGSLLDKRISYNIDSILQTSKSLSQVQLKNHLDLCDQHIDGKKKSNPYLMLEKLFEKFHVDNMKILKALIYAKDDAKDDLQPLVDGTTKTKANVGILRRKNVLLLISDPDISMEELTPLEEIYKESCKQNPERYDSQYEVVWLPIITGQSVTWTDDTMKKKFDDLQAKMPWHIVHQPSSIDPSVTRFIKEKWYKWDTPILVVLDPQGRVVSPNALHMVWIWRILAFSFTLSREEILWKAENPWRLEFLVNDNIIDDPSIMNGINEEKFICLYGSEDIEWIRGFTTTLQAVGLATGISLEMIYVGKRGPKKIVKEIIETIKKENLGHCLKDINSVEIFWKRLESMWHSKVQIGKRVDEDPIMQEIMRMLILYGSDGGWALLSKGSADQMIKAKGDIFFKCLEELKGNVQQKSNFIPALKERIQKLQSPHHCNQLLLQSIADIKDETLVCLDCGRTMKKLVMYECCGD